MLHRQATKIPEKQHFIGFEGQNRFSPYNIYRILTVHVFSSCSILSSVFKNDETGKVQKNENQKTIWKRKYFTVLKICV